MSPPINQKYLQFFYHTQMIQAENKFCEANKEENGLTYFYLRIGGQNLGNPTNLLTGELAVPQIGKYSRNQYHFLNVDALVQLELIKKEDNWVTEAQGQVQGQTIHLPESVKLLLDNVPEQIVHNKPPPKQNKKNKKQNKKQSKQKQQEELEAQQMQQELEEENEVVPEFHPINFLKPDQKLKFTWTISSLQTNKILQPLKQEPCLSYVNHNWVFENINFEFQKKLTALIPVCVLEPVNIVEYNDPHKSLSFFQLRSEYMSVHLGPKGSLCFSPNNMKVFVDLNASLASFWTIILQEDRAHHIYCHWIILSEIYSEMSHQICKGAKNLAQLLEMYQELAPEFKAQAEVLRNVYMKQE